MADNEKSPCISKDKFHLLPIKLHFILLFGASGGVIPYVPVVGKHLGLTATSAGIVFTVQPLALLLAKPAFGALTDHLRSSKAVMISLLLVQCVSYLTILFIPPIQEQNVEEAFILQCNTKIPEIAMSRKYNSSCSLEMMKNLTCTFELVDCSSIEDCRGTCNRSEYHFTGDITVNERSTFQLQENDVLPLSMKPKAWYRRFFLQPDQPYNLQVDSDSSDVSSPCNCGNSTWKALNCSQKLESCLYDEEKLVYNSYQFWLFTVLVVTGGSCAGALFTLSDAACYEILENRPDLYGKQRLWATASWGIVTLLTGYLNGLSSSGKSGTDYGPGFYIMTILLFLDLILLYCMKLPKSKFSKSIFKDVKRIFASVEIVAFAVAVFIVGGLSGLLWNYQFWYFENQGASQLLLGLMVATQCLLAEVPFFLMSSCMIRTFGHFYCLVGTFAANSLRYLLYYFLRNPWYVLPVELLHGQTYATFYATLTSFASQKAPPGTEATMLGVFGGLFEGLGVGVGSLLSGVGFDHIGGRNTFLVAGIFSGVCALLFVLVKFAVSHPSYELHIQHKSLTSSTASQIQENGSYQQSGSFRLS